jgi:hypothetical protein
MRHLATLGVSPPGNPRDRVESGRFVRALLVRTLVVVVPLWVLVALIGPPSWVLILGAVSVALLVIDILWLGHRVRRDQRRAGES